MDEVNAVFNLMRPLKKINVFSGSTAGCGVVNEPTEREERKPRLTAGDKAILVDDIECMRQKIEDAMKSQEIADEPEIVTKKYNARSDDIKDDDIDEVYTRFKFDKYSSQELPIYSSKRSILDKIEKWSSLVIVGNTGCGKTTQVPQLILDDAYSKKERCNIVVTQPRRIAARSIADRVSKERGWPLGTVVGYQVGLDKRYVTEDTRILFCTTGVLLEKLISKKSLDGFTHIILDEVHERDKDMDFLFIIIRMLMCQNESKVKVVLMSATINAQKFSEYFKSFENGRWIPAPIVYVEKQNAYNVQLFYIENFFGKSWVSNLNWDTPGISEHLYRSTLKIIRSFEDMDREEQILPSILIFLPGIYEIGCMHTALKEYGPANSNWTILILHSLISSEDQLAIFQPAKQNSRKIILSTNIAESSITVPDVKYVIDFCLTKYLKTHPSRNFTSLELDWASQDNCRQRSGRAGRVMDGRCYRMIPRKVFDIYMMESSKPELLLSPLENVILKAKQFEMGPPHVLLGLAMDPPKLLNVATTILVLKEIGALSATHGMENSNIDGNMTFMGHIMAALPIDVNASRLIALGYCFSVLEESIIMAATLTSKSIFKITFDRSLTSYSRRLEWSNGSGSDLFAAYNAYRIWSMKYNQNEFGDNPTQRQVEREFCSKHHLDIRSLHECHQLVLELKNRLKKLGIHEITGNHRVRWSLKEKSIILKVVISGAFYPNFFTTIPSNTMNERDIFYVLNGRDPNKTVYFSGFSPDNIRELYVKPLKNLFKNKIVDENNMNDIRISFDKNSEKVFVSFETETKYKDEHRMDWNTKRCSIPGRTQPEVYKALKMRHLKIPFEIPIMKLESEKELAIEVGIAIMDEGRFAFQNTQRDDVRHICIPVASVENISGTITYIESCSKFWFQPLHEKKLVESYTKMLNDPERLMVEPCLRDEKIDKRTIIVARNENDGRFYRARVLGRNADEFREEFSIIFIDFGHKQKCSIDDLFNFSMKIEASQLPPRCFECCLAEIQPSTMNATGGNSWDFEAIELFKSQTRGELVTAKIYSIVNGVANVFITKNDVNFNDVLIDRKFGEFCEENYLSKDNHWRRKLDSKYMEYSDSNAKKGFDCSEYFPITEAEAIDLPGEQLYDRMVKLIGPKSPLESNMYPILDYGNSQSINIDPNSVNCVLLNPYLQESNTRYMTAAHISQSGLNDKDICINETTLLPNIRGFGPLMAMIFCPMADLKRDATKSRYVSLLTGLGYSKQNKASLFPEHDAVFCLDFELNNDDISNINQIRYCISMLLFALGGDKKNETLQESNQIQIMAKLKEVTIGLLLKNRKPIEVNMQSHEWNEYELKDSIKPLDVSGTSLIFSLHGSLRLYPLDNRTKQSLLRHCDDLHSMILNFPRPVTCKLCSIEITNTTILRIHLLSLLHKEREKEIGYTK